MNITIDNEINKIGNIYQLKIKFSDNPFTMIKENIDICQLLKIQSILDNRIKKYFNKESNILKTSDMGFAYIKY
jgi:hypothetical protein